MIEPSAPGDGRIGQRIEPEVENVAALDHALDRHDRALVVRIKRIGRKAFGKGPAGKHRKDGLKGGRDLRVVLAVVAKDRDEAAHDGVGVGVFIPPPAHRLLPEGDRGRELEARVRGGRHEAALFHALHLLLPVLDPGIAKGARKGLFEERIDPALENAPQPQKARALRHVEEPFDRDVDGHPGEVPEGSAVGRHHGGDPGGEFRGPRPCAQRVEPHARFRKGRVKFKRRGPPRYACRVPDGIAKALAAFGVDHDDGLAPQDRLRDEIREHHALPCLRGAHDERAAPEARKGPHDVILVRRPDSVNVGAPDVARAQGLRNVKEPSDPLGKDDGLHRGRGEFVERLRVRGRPFEPAAEPQVRDALPLSSRIEAHGFE